MPNRRVSVHKHSLLSSTRTRSSANGVVVVVVVVVDDGIVGGLTKNSSRSFSHTLACSAITKLTEGKICNFLLG